jgi:hypothetical protein
MTTTIRLWQVGGTEKAYCFSKLPKNKAEGNYAGIWIPRSMIERITRFPAGVGEWQEVHVTVQEWFAEKKGLL